MALGDHFDPKCLIVSYVHTSLFELPQDNRPYNHGCVGAKLQIIHCHIITVIHLYDNYAADYPTTLVCHNSHLVLLS